MIEFMRRTLSRRRPASAETVPDDIARALDASVEDLRHDRIKDIGDFLRRTQGKLDAHLARNAASQR
jgi:hypothetical protein